MKRGQYKRTDEIRAKQAEPSMNRAVSQYTRSCDSKVGRWLRLFRTSLYNRILNRADEEQK